MREPIKSFAISMIIGGLTMIVVLLVIALIADQEDHPTAGHDSITTESDTAKAIPPDHPWRPISGLPVSEPEQLYPDSDGVLNVKLSPEPRVINVSGSPILAQPWGDQLIGPTLHLEPGDTLKVDLSNSLNQPTNIHYHGMHVSPQGDGDNVFRKMSPGESYRSEITVPEDHATGTYWYHVHYHGNTETQVEGGLTGLIIVEGLEDKLPAELQDLTQRQLVFRDIQTTKDGAAIQTGSGKIDSSKPSKWLVNGYLRPQLQPIAPGEIQLWRLSNQSADLFYHIKLEKHPMIVLAEDGNPVWETYKAEDLVLPPGKRFDVLVQGSDEGSYKLKTLPFDEGFELLPQKTLATLPVTGDPVDDQLPKTPLELSDKTATSLAHAEVSKRRLFRFSFGTSPKGAFEALINGDTFDPSKIDVTPVVNTVEQWKLVNDSNEDHPFHIHVNDFQVMRVNGKPYHAHGLQDVVIIPKNGGSVVIRNPFEDFTGEFVFHCHILAHEDAGMMQSVEVVGSKSEARETQHIDQGEMPMHHHNG